MPQRLQNPKWPSGGPKMADGVWKGVSPLVIGRSEQLWLNRFCDPSYIFCVLQRVYKTRKFLVCPETFGLKLPVSFLVSFRYPFWRILDFLVSFRYPFWRILDFLVSFRYPETYFRLFPTNWTCPDSTCPSVPLIP